jgi:hypothetical protein
MKTFFVMMIVAGLVSGAAGQPLETAENVAKTTAEKTKEAAHTVAHGVKKAANKIEDALTPDPDARRVDVTVNDGEVNMSSDLEPGKTAFVVKNEGKTTTNFEVTGGDIDHKFVAPPGPGETKVLHVTLKRGVHYTIYSTNKDDGEGEVSAHGGAERLDYEAKNRRTQHELLISLGSVRLRQHTGLE